MPQSAWKLSATELAAKIRSGEISCRDATENVLDRIEVVNARYNALPDVMTENALRAADAADAALSRGDPPGPLHGVPVTIKVNVDTEGRATTDGIVTHAKRIASTNSPLVEHLLDAGAIIVGRSNTPAFSLRWFTDNDLHGRTLNPFDAAVTPGGSSGGAAVAVATGMGPIAHGNDYGGSIRYPAWACGVVGLRTTVGRVPSYKATSPARSISNQLMSVQGPLTRTVADAELALRVMARGSALDPNWVPAPLDYAESAGKPRAAVFASHDNYDVDPTVVRAVEHAAGHLENAGYDIEQATPPDFEEAAQLWRLLVMEDMRDRDWPAVVAEGDHGVRCAIDGYMTGLAAWGRQQYLDGLARRLEIGRGWARFLERFDVLLMPNSWQRQFPIDADCESTDAVDRILAAQSPLLSTAMLGLPGLSIPLGLDHGLPSGVQIVSWRFREDRALRAGNAIEAAAAFNVLDIMI